jgi:hypothetical protein
METNTDYDKIIEPFVISSIENIRIQAFYALGKVAIPGLYRSWANATYHCSKTNVSSL